MRRKSDDLLFLKLNPDDYQAKLIINSIFSVEPFPIYEHNWQHIFSYASFRSKIYLLQYHDFYSISIMKYGKIYLFTPYFQNIESFQYVVEFFKNKKYDLLKILNVSENWINNFNLYNHKHKIVITHRSQNEALYSVDLLSDLKGKQFTELRQTRNRVLKKQVIFFKKINRANLSDCFYLIDQWHKVQGSKYLKNKVNKEKFTVKRFLNFLDSGSLCDSNSFCRVSYFSDKPIGYCLSFIHPSNRNYLICYTVKGINKINEGGFRGTSDSLYLKIVDFCRNNNVKYINDGDLGLEKGTIKHKEKFRPINYLKSFDVELYV